MKIETRKIELGTYHLERKGEDKVLSSPRAHKTYAVTAFQEKCLAKISAGMTLEAIATESIARQQPFSFRELYHLIELLLETEVIIDAYVRNYFEPSDHHLHPGTERGTRIAPAANESMIGHWNTQHLADLPFFRNLSQPLLRTFLSHAELDEVPERTKIISYGDTGRDLFVIFEGEASIYIPGLKHRKLITTIPAGSIFGEGGFFFGKPRTADVISNVPCCFARIKFDEPAFHSVIHSAATNHIQQRLWILHGLLSSPLFHHVPPDTMDRFVMAGQLRTLKPGELMFKIGDPGNSFYVVIQGHVDIFHHGKIIKTLKQGDLFGEIALMINEGERTADAKAMDESLLLEVRHEEFYKVLAQNLILAKEIEEIAHRRYNHLIG